MLSYSWIRERLAKSGNPFSKTLGIATILAFVLVGHAGAKDSTNAEKENATSTLYIDVEGSTDLCVKNTIIVDYYHGEKGSGTAVFSYDEQNAKLVASVPSGLIMLYSPFVFERLGSWPESQEPTGISIHELVDLRSWWHLKDGECLKLGSAEVWEIRDQRKPTINDGRFGMDVPTRTGASSGRLSLTFIQIGNKTTVKDWYVERMYINVPPGNISLDLRGLGNEVLDFHEAILARLYRDDPDIPDSYRGFPYDKSSLVANGGDVFRYRVIAMITNSDKSGRVLYCSRTEPFVLEFATHRDLRKSAKETACNLRVIQQDHCPK